MHIEQLHLENFKGFEKASFGFGPGINVLIGENGSGKTSVLEALSVILEHYQFHFSNRKEPLPYHEKELARWVRLVQMPMGLQYVSYLQVNALVKNLPYQTITDEEVDYTIARGGGAPPNVGFKSKAGLTTIFGREPTRPFHLISIFDSSRAAGENDELTNYNIVNARHISESGYSDCMKPNLKFKLVREWIRDTEFTVLKHGKLVEPFTAVKNALIACVPGFKDISFDPSFFMGPELIITLEKENGTTEQVPLPSLGEGLKVMVAIIGELAIRCCTLNPYLGERACLDTPGIVLIDEIDEHLHPRWQQRILLGLRQAFPLMQFIVTTHSPFIIQGLRKNSDDRLIDLDFKIQHGYLEDPYVNANEDYLNGSIDEISEHIMNVVNPKESLENQQKEAKALAYYQKLNEEGVPDEVLDEMEKEIESRYGEDPAFLAFLKFQRIAAQSKKSNAAH